MPRFSDYDSALVHFESYLITERRSPKNTVAAYRSDLKQMVSFLTENDRSLTTCRHEDLVEFLSSLYAKQLGTRTVGRKIAAIRLFFDFVTEESANNPAAKLVLPRYEKKLPYYLTQEQVSRLLETACVDRTLRGVRNALMVYLLYAGGLRISELLLVRIKDFRFSEGFLQVSGKGGKERSVPLPTEVLGLARHVILKVLPELISQDVTPESFLFIKQASLEPLSRQQCWRLLRGLCKEAGISSVSPHVLRHSLATHLLAQGADLRQLQQLMGHEKIDTVQIYTHVESDRLRSLYDKSHPRS